MYTLYYLTSMILGAHVKPIQLCFQIHNVLQFVSHIANEGIKLNQMAPSVDCLKKVFCS